MSPLARLPGRYMMQGASGLATRLFLTPPFRRKPMMTICIATRGDTRRIVHRLLSRKSSLCVFLRLVERLHGRRLI